MIIYKVYAIIFVEIFEKKEIKMTVIEKLTEEFKIKPWQAENTVKLLDEGNTVPFIARYRKEATGSLDDQLLRELFDRLNYLRNMDETREKIKAAIDEAGALSEKLSLAIDNAKTLSELEDIYRPYKKHKKTRADVAKEKGLLPLAELILRQENVSPDILAKDYIDGEKGVENIEDALSGASDIIAEIISNDPDIRKRMRIVCSAHGVIKTKADKENAGVYEMYADYSEPVSKIANHRVLAINRGEKENVLKVSVEFDDEKAMFIVCRDYVKKGPCSDFVKAAARDSYNRLIFPSIEREIRATLTEKASEDAIKVFSENLKQLLMQPPVKDSVTLGLDPGYRTGCKVAVVDGTGKVLYVGVIYPVPPVAKVEEAKRTVKDLINKFSVTTIAIGNGTASHETEVFAAEVIKETNLPLSYMVVSEAGASVYSASKLAAKEFPDFDVSLRSAVSIARRLQDPLSELVKIDPKAIGVGQYQHDLPANRLNDALEGVVESCVNRVGVDLNTASVSLLSYVAGLNKTTAENIVSYREENGRFRNRNELKKVSKIGPKAFLQCAGFLRITGGDCPLDSTGVHPESYKATNSLLALFGFSENDIENGKIKSIVEKTKDADTASLSQKLGIGEITLRDIISELAKPGRDPRDELPKPLLRSDVMTLSDLKSGMELKGTVRNVVDFGAFVDIGVHEDGLVHISQICDRFIKHPSEVLKVGDVIKVKVLDVDSAKKRISLTMKGVKND